ncbi:O-antigen polymerase [Olleya sp. AS48]|uniref:O-antigen polymerase n=1 Tax=Olleya sp. AS48 TaxID=3135774 RepID=UPI0030D85CCC
MHLVTIIFFLFFYHKVALKSSATKIIVSIYCISLLLGFFLEFLDFKYYKDEWNYMNMIFIVATMLLSFKSLSSFDLVEISGSKKPLIYDSLILKIIVFLSIISTFLYLVDFIKFLQTPNLGDARLEHQLEGNESKGFIYSFFATISFSFHINIFLFFDLIKKNKKVLGMIVLFASFSYVFWVSSVFGRDGFVFWMISFLFYYLLFKKELSAKIKKKFHRIFLIFGILFLFLFLKLSSSRFTDSNYYYGNENLNPVVLSLLDYGGQQLRNANDYYNMDIDHTYGLYNFPYIYRSFIGSNQLKKEKENVQWQIASNGKKHFYFAYYLKELWIDFGAIGTLIVCSLFVTVVSFLSKVKKLIPSSYLIYIVYTQFLLMGLFYNKFYFPSANAYVIFIVLLVLIESLVYGKKA